MHKGRKEEERERKTDQEQRKKKDGEKGLEARAVFTHLGMGSDDALWRHWAVVADASGNQTSTPPQLGILFPLMLWLEWMDKRTRQTHGICLLCQFPLPLLAVVFPFAC